jgi:hypothetical protein
MALTVRDIVKSIDEGRYWDCYFHKNFGGTAATAGRWYDGSMLGGHYGSNPYVGTALAATKLWYKSVGGLWHGTNVSPKKKHLLLARMDSTSSTGYPSYFILCDYLVFYPFIDLDSTNEQVLDNTVTLPRYTDGAGVKAFLVCQIEAGASQIGMTMQYTNQDGVEGKTTPYTLQITPSSIVTQVLPAGTLASQYGPFIPLAEGDTGIRKVESITFDAGMGAGYGSLVLCKPLASLPFLYYYSSVEQHQLIDCVRLPEIKDEAFLGVLMFAGAAIAAASRFIGKLSFVWN